MSEEARGILELVEQGSWRKLTTDDHRRMKAWLLRATPYDLFMLLWHGYDRWSRLGRKRRSSSATLQAIRDHEEDG